MTGDIDRTVVQPAADDARDDASHRWFFAGMAIMLVGVLGLTAFGFVLATRLSDAKTQLTTSDATAQSAYSAVQQLSKQVQDLGGTPVASAPAPGSPGQAGATGAMGPGGAVGPKGDTGAVGPAPSTDFLFSLIKPLIPAPIPGTNGTPGATGATGPKGDPGVSVKGDPGTNGTNGVDGATGPPGPVLSAYGYTDALGVQHECTRAAADTNDGDPQYVCT